MGYRSGARAICQLHPNRATLVRVRRLFGLDDEQGGSLVEFALVLPMMMVLITGMFSIGIALNNFMVLTNAVGAGARALSLTRGQTVPALAGTDPCAYAIGIANNAAPSLQTGTITYSVVWTPTSGTGGTYSTSCAGVSFGSGDTVKVQGTYPYTLMLYGLRPSSLSITSQTSELVQ